MEGEQVRRAFDRGCDWRAVMAALGIPRCSTFNKVKRAYAYDCLLDAFSRGGRPSESTQAGGGSTVEGPVQAGDEQQRLDTVVETTANSLARTETWGDADSESNRSSSTGTGSVVDARRR